MGGVSGDREIAKEERGNGTKRKLITYIKKQDSKGQVIAEGKKRKFDPGSRNEAKRDEKEKKKQDGLHQ